MDQVLHFTQPLLVIYKPRNCIYPYPGISIQKSLVIENCFVVKRKKGHNKVVIISKRNHTVH